MKIVLNHGSKLHPALLKILDKVENELGLKVIVTDSDRTFKEHVDLYKKLFIEGKLDGSKQLIDQIPFNSRHLPTFMSVYLRAVDVNILDGDKKLSGDEIEQTIKPIAWYIGVKLGFGKGSTFAHIDIREKEANWNYNY